jgi:hypothetical protein
VGVRYERLDDEGLFGGIEQVLQETTLAAEYKLADGFLVRAELRRDWSNERFFPGRFRDADLQQAQNTALVGGVWWFGTKDGVWQEGVCCSRLERCCWGLRHSSHWSRSLSSATACRW